MSIYINISYENLFKKNEPPESFSNQHSPYFLALCDAEKPENTYKALLDAWNIAKNNNKAIENPLSTVRNVNNIEEYTSFWNPAVKRHVCKVHTQKPSDVPKVSDKLFFDFGIATAEHDIPYNQRAIVDFASSDKAWIFDSAGKKTSLNILCYDIETTKYSGGESSVPIDLIGYSYFDVSFTSSKDLNTEDFYFELHESPTDWENREIFQLESNSLDDEIENLKKFCKILMQYDIISGHNILSFDNKQIYNRIEYIKSEQSDILSKDNLSIFNTFLYKYAMKDQVFSFGTKQATVNFYPTSFDTYFAARRFYFFLDNFGLKNLALFLGIKIPNRVYLIPGQIKLDDRMRKYNVHDVKEQLGVTMLLIQQALPLAFTTGMPFEMLLPSGSTKIWDHMSMIRSARHRKIVPPICRVETVSKDIISTFGEHCTKAQLFHKIRTTELNDTVDQKSLVRIVKYGDEMPDWVEYPYVIFNKNYTKPEEKINYHFPGGMTLKPDVELKSDFILWWKVIVADVGAMYPTILKALNVGADTVRLAYQNEEPDDWIWLKKIPKKFLEKSGILFRLVSEKEKFADVGYMLGIKISDNPGVVNLAMTAVMKIITKVKRNLAEAKKNSQITEEELRRIQMTYNSLKALRNAGTHGILTAPSVSCRQFNLWAGAEITTKGQMILQDTLEHLEKNGVRVVYGDTDGIYLACSNTVRNVPTMLKALGLQYLSGEPKKWLYEPEKAMKLIDECNEKWRKQLNYHEFELEPEIHDAMLFVKHKNYLIWDVKKDKVIFTAKGNNFRGADKPNIAKFSLENIMIDVLKDNVDWIDEDLAKDQVKSSIKKHLDGLLSSLNLEHLNKFDFELLQSVKPPKQYADNPNGSPNIFKRRAIALEKLVGHIKVSTKFKFVVTRDPLPFIDKPTKTGLKPIDYMYPVELLDDVKKIDIDWYKIMISNYIYGAFGLKELSNEASKSKQVTLKDFF